MKWTGHSRLLLDPKWNIYNLQQDKNTNHFMKKSTPHRA